jgi:glycosyltransferase involved in cell wall biosynthesis
MQENFRPGLSVVVPLFNEEESVPLLYKALVDATTGIGIEVELIFVDDGSGDDTFGVAEKLALKDSRLRVVKFRRNYGQTPAMAAGIDLARGDLIITMDGDLQNDPRDISHFVEKINEGFDIVVGWRHDRQDKLISRKIPSKIANWIIGKVTGVPIKDNGCSLKAFRADVIKTVPLYSEMHRFIPAMASIAGPRLAEIKVRHHARQFGESKYGLSRVYKVLLDLLTIKTISGFSARPLSWFAALALPFIILSFIMAAWVASRLISTDSLSLPISGSALFFATLSIFLIFGGALGELINATGDQNVSKYSLLTATELRPEAEASSAHAAEAPDNE